MSGTPRNKSRDRQSQHDNREERFIDRFDVLLLDVGETFMFDADRFNEDDDLYDTYLNFGGKGLDRNVVEHILQDVFHQLVADSKISESCENFQSLAVYMEMHTAAGSLPRHELDLLEKVFTEHEIGKIPERYTEVLNELAVTHRLGIISDIFAKSDRFYQEFESAGIRELFEVIIFSSDIGILKPSPKIFKKAVEALDTDISRIVYIGDSYRRDVSGAKEVGMPVIWINKERTKDMPIEPDLTITDLQDILLVQHPDFSPSFHC